MLVLTRKKSESIRIGNDIVIKVIQTGKGTVKIGIEAPAHVRVLRAELAEFADEPNAVSVTDDEDEQPGSKAAALYASLSELMVGEYTELTNLGHGRQEDDTFETTFQDAAHCSRFLATCR